MPRGRDDDGLGWNPDAVEPMEPTEPTEPMELTEPMEPMELTEPMEPMEPAEPIQEEEMEPRRKEIKIHRVGMGKGYGSSASSAAEGKCTKLNASKAEEEARTTSGGRKRLHSLGRRRTRRASGDRES